MRIRVPTRLTPGFLRRAAKDESGVTAIEFALVAGPFLALLFGIISVGFYFFAVFSLEHAVEVASRQIRTGAAQTGGKTAEAFKTDVCNELPQFMSCANVRISVTSGTDYSVSAATCLAGPSALIADAAGASSSTNAGFNMGSASSVVIVTVCFEWQTSGLTNLAWWISPASARMGNGNTWFSAVTVLTSEPYS